MKDGGRDPYWVAALTEEQKLVVITGMLKLCLLTEAGPTKWA